MTPARAVDSVQANGLTRALRTFGFFVYYLAIIILLLWIYGRGDTPTAPFVYQGF